MNEDKIKKLEKDYIDTKIPIELNNLVLTTIKKNKRKGTLQLATVFSVSICLIFVILINYNPVFASEINKIPVINNIAKLVTINKYSIKDSKRNVDLSIDLAKLDGLVNKDLQKSLNNKYLKESQKLYSDFLIELNSIDKNQIVNQGLYADYSIAVNNNDLLVIKQIVTKTSASSEEIANYDTIDTKNQVLITLPSLFKDNRYINIISNNIKMQMETQMKNNKNKLYNLEYFDKIGSHQKFYISNENKLIIVFDSYSISPGFMGLVSFEIPSEILQEILVSNNYIK